MRRIFLACLVVMLPSLAYAASPADIALVETCFNRDSASYDRAFGRETVIRCTEALLVEGLDTDTRVRLLVQRGVTLMHIGQNQEALPDMLRATELDPSSAEAQRLLAWNLRQLGRHADADKAYGKALEIEPHWQGYLSRCVVRIDQQNMKGALADCEKAVSLAKNEDIHYFTASLYLHFERYADVVALLNPATKSADTSGRVFGLLAEAHKRMGKNDLAADVTKQGIAKFPEDRGLVCPPPTVPCAAAQK